MLNPRLRKILDWTIGLTLIALGIAGWILPLLPGWLCIFAGLAVLSSHSRWARVLHERVQRFGRAVRDKAGAGKTGGDSGPPPA